jgi:hypothetical protein
MAVHATDELGFRRGCALVVHAADRSVRSRDDLAVYVADARRAALVWAA